MNRVSGHRWLLRKALCIALLACGCASSQPRSARDTSTPKRSDANRTTTHETRPLLSPGVHWILAPDAGERDRLNRWWEAVGTPVVHKPDVELSQQADSLVLVAWNLHSGGGDIFSLVDDLRSGKFTGTAVPHFVLLLQEAFRIDADTPAFESSHIPRRIEAQPPSGPRRDILDIAHTLDLWMFYVPSMRNGPPGSGETEEDRGSAILSTLPLAGYTAIELPFESQRRVSVAATVNGISTNGTEWNLRVCSAHLDPRSVGIRFFSGFGSGRQRQARFLADSLPESPAVVAGDLNTWSFRFMETALTVFRKEFPSTPSPRGKSFTIPWFTDRRLDHMYFRLPDLCSARYILTYDTYGSDHRPLVGWITCAPGE